MSPYAIIKLNATASTNTYLKDLSRTTTLKDATVVVTEKQSKGRGQHGASWFSEDKKSLACSLYKVFDTVEVKDSFYISMAVAVGIAETLIALQIPNVKVKWPNDIMSRGKKCGGILIENFLQRKNIKGSIIGVGLNINNESFPELPHATSLKLASGQHYNVSEILDEIVRNMLQKLQLVEEGVFHEIYEQYHQMLFMKNKVQVFEDLTQTRFNAIVEHVTPDGLLQLSLESGIVKTYNLKEVKFCL